MLSCHSKIIFKGFWWICIQADYFKVGRATRLGEADPAYSCCWVNWVKDMNTLTCRHLYECKDTMNRMMAHFLIYVSFHEPTTVFFQSLKRILMWCCSTCFSQVLHTHTKSSPPMPAGLSERCQVWNQKFGGWIRIYKKLSNIQNQLSGKLNQV